MRKLVPVYPWPMHESVKAALDAITAFEINVVEAVPGGPTPILAINKVPDFATDAIVVRSPEHIEAAARIVTSNGIEVHTVRDVIGRMVQRDLPFEVVEERGPRFE